jgi:hypothetical protein
MAAQLADARQIFLEAVEHHAPEQWPEFLDSACQNDAELRARVEALLKAHGRTGNWSAAIEALQKSKDPNDEKYFSWDAFFRAMAHWRLGRRDEACE